MTGTQHILNTDYFFDCITHVINDPLQGALLLNKYDVKNL